MKYLCIWLVRFYQKFLSPLKRNPTCRFTPSCSAYAIDAFMKRGFFVGFALTVWRVLRCNPFVPGGYDPVPDKRRHRVKGADLTPNVNDKQIQREENRVNDDTSI